MFKYSMEFVSPNATTRLNLVRKSAFYKFSNNKVAYVMQISIFYRLLSAEKMSTGRLIFMMDLPVNKFLPILAIINFKTPF